MKSRAMKKLSVFSVRMVMVIISAFFLTNYSHAQTYNSNTDVYLGKIQVYSFTFDSLYYTGDVKKLTAVGTEHSADLYSSRVGDNTYFRIVMGGDSYAVVTNPYGKKVVSNRNYSSAWIKKDGSYIPIPTLAYMAGDYFLDLPYSKTENNVSSSSTPAPVATAKSQPDWQLMGKVTLYRNMRTSMSHGEEDVYYDTESAFLYSTFDGSKTKYKITIPKYASQYDVHENGSYDGSHVQWGRNGKRITYLPSLSQMYTHYAGSYYFNVADVRH